MRLLVLLACTATAWMVTNVASAAERRAIEEIIVTATKRAESIQDVPIAVTAINAQQLERTGVQDLRDLGNVSASFQLSASQTESQGSNLRLRGVGTTGNNIGLESAVGVFLDGIYLSRPGVALGDLFDVEQIEVLRGPQGTLFGRNTSAGALSISTKKPDLTTPELWANATASNFEAYNLQIGGNLPVIENELAFRLAGAVRQQDGFMRSTSGADSMTRDRYTLRGQMLWAFSDTADLRVIADYADADEECCDAAIIYESPITAAGAYAAAGLPANGGVAASGESAFDDRVSNAEQFENPFEQWGLSAELNWMMGGVSGTYIGSYRDFKADSVQFDFVGIDVYSVRPEETQGWETFDDIKTWTHELRFAGQWGRLDWLVGAYFSDEEIVEQQGLGLGEDYSENISATAWYGGIYPAFGAAINGLAPIPLATGGTFGDVLAATDPARAFAGGVDSATAFAQNEYTQDSTSWSIFTHNRLALTDSLDLVVGLRWADEEKDGSFVQFDAENNACLNTLANGAAVAAAAPGAGDTIQALSAAFMCFPFATPADTGVPILPATFSDSFEDDELIYTGKLVYAFNDLTNGYASFTHGFKAGGFNLDSTAAVGGADPRFDSELIDSWELGLKTDFWDQRLRANIALFYMEMEDFQVLEFTGVQFVTFNVPKAESQGLELEMSGSLTEALNFNFAVTYADAEYPDDCATTSDPVQVQRLCGGQLTNAPEWVSVAGFNYEGLVGNNLAYFVSANARWEDDRRTSTQYRTGTAPDAPRLLFDIQEDNIKVNLRVGIGDISERWQVELWGNNIFDEQTRNVTANTPLRGTDAFGTASRIAFIEAPRTYGLTFRTRM